MIHDLSTQKGRNAYVKAMAFKKEKYIIQDWAGNHLFKDKEFDSFEEGWEFIYENVQEETEDDGTYEDLYVVNKKDFKL